MMGNVLLGFFASMFIAVGEFTIEGRNSIHIDNFIDDYWKRFSLWSPNLCKVQKMIIARNILELLLDNSLHEQCLDDSFAVLGHSFNYAVFLDTLLQTDRCDSVWLEAVGFSSLVPAREEVVYYLDVGYVYPVNPRLFCKQFRDLFPHYVRERSLLDVLEDVLLHVHASGLGIEILSNGSLPVYVDLVREHVSLDFVYDTIVFDVLSVLFNHVSPDFLSLTGNCEFLSQILLYHSAIKVLQLRVCVGVVCVDELCKLNEAIRVVNENMYRLVAVSTDGVAIFTRVGLTTYMEEFFSIENGPFIGGVVCSVRAALHSPSLFDVSPTVISRVEYLHNYGPFTQSRALLSSANAHCFEKKCECIYPFFGFLCVRKDYPIFLNVVYYLTSKASLIDLEYSLVVNLKNSPLRDLPVIVFYDSEIDVDWRMRLGKVWFANQFFVNHPRRETNSVHYRPMGYRQICRFESGPIFWHPAMSFEFEKIIRLDTDGYFPSVEIMGEIGVSGEYVLGHVGALIPVPPNRIDPLSELLALYTQKASSSLNTQTSLPLHPQTPIMSINNPPYIFDWSFFTSKKWKNYFQFIDGFDGFYKFGILGNAVITQGVMLLGGRIKRLNIPWAHVGHCECIAPLQCTMHETKWHCL